MLNIFKKKENEKIVACAIGRAIPSNEVSDPTFAEEMLGKGMAIEPSEGKLYAPVDGEVTLVFDTKHAIAITSELGTEILLHVGIDTVKLEGKPFNVLVEMGQKVKKGQLIMEFDIDQIKEAGYDSVIPVIICNSADFSDVIRNVNKDVSKNDVVMEIVR